MPPRPRGAPPASFDAVTRPPWTDGRTQPASAVAEQFLGMICGQLLWPQLVRTDFVPPDPTDTTVVDEAVALMRTRYRARS
ncbi:TetR/AcrR family transcriptional regulator C-terminal domain-containing protein [Streptomyces sp. NPDC058295]|uniref:TetR/AcrR family transcriptional regulator C-terminal domain-containing protein n=1 Tax=Streptomyces sp. NPDC058295 TaxID=3346431 RepID=UPI0036E01522